MKIIFTFLMFMTFSAWGLEVDEKLTVRLLKVSETRKTIMVNRGTEDGLVEGDHARFIVTAGIVARAVCVKVSPSRSVWSIYRLVNADFIGPDAVMTLKITPPVKITKDETQAIVQEDIPSKATGEVTPLGIPLAEGAQDLNQGDVDAAAELKALEDSDGPMSIVERSREIYTLLNISSLAASTKSDGDNGSFKSSQSYHHIGIGGELYAQNERQWYSTFSLMAAVNLMRLNNQSYNGIENTNEVTEFEVGTNWHPSKLPSAVHEFIPYFHLGFTFGSVKSSTEVPGGETISASGSSTGFSAGGGYKFYTARGYGARFLVDYYVRNESYGEDDLKASYTKTVGGPRVMLGFSYRF